MSHEFYQPGKESRDIRRDQERRAQENDDGTMREVRLGFARSYTETAKPGDTLRRMIKRAYKNGKLYGEKQASEAADRVIGLFGPANITRVKQGDRITFRNDMIIFRFFEPQADGKRDKEFPLTESDASLNYKRRVVVSSSTAQRAALAEGPADAVAETGVSKRPAAQAELSPAQLLAQQCREVIRAFIVNTEELKPIISNGHPETVTAIISHKISSPDSRIPAQFRAYEFSQIICNIGDAIDDTSYLIGLDPQSGKVVLFKASTPDKVTLINVSDSSSLKATLPIALHGIAHPNAID